MTKLNLTFNNLRRGDFSNRHAMVDVYLDGKFISTYQWNPFWNMDTDKLLRALKYNRCIANGWRNREVEDILGVDRKSAEINLAIWQGKRWGKKLNDEYDKKLSDLIFKYAEIEMPKDNDVESALVKDAELFESSRDFEDFCLELGYDTDSRKAERDYNECQNIFCRIIKSVGMDGFQELKETHFED